MVIVGTDFFNPSLTLMVDSFMPHIDNIRFLLYNGVTLKSIHSYRLYFVDRIHEKVQPILSPKSSIGIKYESKE